MSQIKVLIVFTIAIILVISLADAKRVGCASFGHSCYGGFGKRSMISAGESSQSMDLPPLPSDLHQNGPLLKIFPRHIAFHQDIQSPTQSDATEQEKELKLIILNVMSQIVDEAIKKISGDFESN